MCALLLPPEMRAFDVSVSRNSTECPKPDVKQKIPRHSCSAPACVPMQRVHMPCRCDTDFQHFQLNGLHLQPRLYSEPLKCALKEEPNVDSRMSSKRSEGSERIKVTLFGDIFSLVAQSRGDLLGCTQNQIFSFYIN